MIMALIQGLKAIPQLELIQRATHFQMAFHHLLFFYPFYFYQIFRVFVYFLLFLAIHLFNFVCLLLFPLIIQEENQVLFLQYFEDLLTYLPPPRLFSHYARTFSIFSLHVFPIIRFFYLSDELFILDFGFEVKDFNLLVKDFILQVQVFKRSLYCLYFPYLFDAFPSIPFFFTRFSSFSLHINVSILQFFQVFEMRFSHSQIFPHVFNLNWLLVFLEGFLPMTGSPFHLFLGHFPNDFIFYVFYLCPCLCHAFPSFLCHFQKIFHQYQQNFPQCQVVGSIQNLRKVLQFVDHSIQIGYRFLFLHPITQRIRFQLLLPQQGHEKLYLSEYKYIYFVGTLWSLAYWFNYNRGLFIRNRLRKYHEGHEGCCQQFFHQQQNENMIIYQLNRPSIQIKAISLNCPGL